jgi:NADH-quinone oxidoreductase subunit B
VYVPGCPPGPETLLHGILQLHEQIKSGELMKRRKSSPSGGAGIEIAQRDGVAFTPIGTAPARVGDPQPVASAAATEAPSA